MNLWLTEYQDENLALMTRIKQTLYTNKSEFQRIEVVDSFHFGRMLVLDGVFQTSIVDEFIYHEMIVHVPLYAHPKPQRVLVIGGGDGGSIREIVKHPAVEQAVMVEIDGMVVEAAKQFLPETAEALINKHPKVELYIDDGIKHVKEHENYYDVIIVDCSDPIGPNEGLFNYGFYKNAHRSLKADGIFVQQSESPFLHTGLIKRIWDDLGSMFTKTELYLANIPLYPSGLHSFIVASKEYNPRLIANKDTAGIVTRYYNEDIHAACFALPNFAQKILK